MEQPEDQGLPSLKGDLGQFDANQNDEIYDFLVDDYRDSDMTFEDVASLHMPPTTPPTTLPTTLPSVDPIATILDPMDVQLPSLTDHSFSPTFHEWSDHNQFFNEDIQSPQPSTSGRAITPATFDSRDLDALQRALFSAGTQPLQREPRSPREAMLLTK